MSDARLIEFGHFLRSRRLRLDPQAMGLMTLRRRRTRGLRREEVAERAGIGVDWYVRLEQGRTVNPSVTTIDALARALCLSHTEHRHLRALAGARDASLFKPENVPDRIRRVVQGLNQPAYVTGRRSDLLCWNTAAEEIFAFGRIADVEPNILLYLLTRPEARQLFGTSWQAEARRVVAMFRATHDLWAGDPAFTDLLDRLQRGCPEFARWWDTHDIVSSGAGDKTLLHPRHGRLRFAYATFQANDDPGLKLSIYTRLPDAGAPGTD